MYKPFFHKKASKYYKSLDDKTARRVNKAIGDMTKIPLKPISSESLSKRVVRGGIWEYRSQ